MSEFGKMNPYTETEDKERYAILGLEYQYDDWGNGGTRAFYNLKVDALKELIAKGYIDLDERQNDSPTTEDFLELLTEYHDFHAHGYLIVNSRDDRCIVIEGIESDIAYDPMDEEDQEEVESILDELEQRIEDMGYYTEEIGLYTNELLDGKDHIWLWWD